MNKKGQFSIIASLLVSIILVSTVMITYNIILNDTIQDQPQVLSAIDETNFAIKQLLGFSVGYYGSVIQVTGDTSYANSSTFNYTYSGLEYVANTHPSWGAGFSLANLTIHTYWFNSTSYSTGYLRVSYNLTKLGIYGMQYAPSCGLTVQITNTTQINQTSLRVSQDQNEPVINLQVQNFKFLKYETNSTWSLIAPSTAPTAFTNGTYQIASPPGVDASSYSIQVTDSRGITVLASSFCYYNVNMTWPAASSTSSSYHYVNNNTSDVDSNGNTGTQSNFTAQQYGPDNINDTLTETNLPTTSGNTQYVQTNSSLHDTNIGGTSNFPTEQSTDNTYDTLTEANTNATSTAYIPITFTNTQSSATPNPFQEKITWNPSSYTSYEASDLGNIRFYSDSNFATPLYAWLETCTPTLSNTATSATAWVKLTSPIAANGGALTIYMVFLSTSTDFDGNYWGNAPNLSPTYGQYDNGANVFSFYDNFAGTTISSAWNTAGAAGTYSVNNGLTVYSGAFPTYVFTLNNQYTGPLIVDAYQVGTTGDWLGASFSNLQTTDASYSLTTGAIQWLYPPQGPWGSFTGLLIASGGTAVTPNPPDTTLQVVTLAVNSTVATEYQNYANPVTASGTISLTNYPGLVQLAYNPSSDTQTTYWFRLRAYPPNNVAPSTSFGSVAFLNANYRLDLERQWTTASYNANASKLLCIKTGAFSDSEALEVDVWNGAWTALNSNLVANQWNNISVSSYLTSATFNIRFIDTNSTNDTTKSTWQVDSVLLYTSNQTDNYLLDLEEQWTNANYVGANKDLDIFTGPFSSPSESLSVQWWNTTSSSWSTILFNGSNSLNANSWNNASVTTYFTSSTFVIRFVDGSQNGDPLQSSWQIDTILLRNDSTVSSAPTADTLMIELLQNGTMQWLGQNLQLTSQSIPIPPLPIKSIHVNQTVNGASSEVPFQVEDWASDYLIPLGMASNSSLFSGNNMIVFLVNNNVSRVTVWWNGSDQATQTSNAYVNRYFTGDNPSAGLLTNGALTLTFTGNWQPVVSSIGGVSCSATFMRINGVASTYGASTAYIISKGVVRDIVQQEAEWSGGVTNCPNVYSQMVLTLPANATYYTYRLRAIFVQSQQNRNITDLSPIRLTCSIDQAQTENGTSNNYPVVSNTSDTYYNQSSYWAHHWSQLYSSGNGAGLMFTDVGNNQLYSFDSIAGTPTGSLRVNATAGTIELLPVSTMASVSFTYALDTIWRGAVSTFSNTTPIYQTVSGQATGSWLSVEYPPIASTSTGN